MFLFIRLLLAHFIGDFPLQLDFVYKLKQKGLKGGIPHALIIACCCLAMSWPYLDQPQVWAFIIFVGIVHLIQDSIKLSYSTPKHSFWTYLLDQAFHAGTIALLFFTGLKDLQPPVDQGSFLVQLYCNDLAIIYLIALIFGTYNGFFMIRVFKITFLGKAERNSAFGKWYGMCERAAIITLFLWPGPAFYLLSTIMCLRPLIYFLFRLPLKLRKDFISSTDILLSWSIALVSGYAMFLLQSGYKIY